MRDIRTTYQLAYRVVGEEDERVVRIDAHGFARPAEDAQALGLCVKTNRGDGYVTHRVVLAPTCEVELNRVVAVLQGVQLNKADALFLNGYNSWTDSVERSPLASMRGLSGVPLSVVVREVLDNSGDYRFVREDPRPGHQHGFGYGYVRRGDDVLLVGSLCEDSGMTLIREDYRRDVLSLDKEPPQVALAPGEEREVMSFAVCAGTLDEATQRWLDLAHIQTMPAPGLVGFTSWYRHYANISENKLLHDLSVVAKTLADRKLPGVRKVFQIDDGYAKVGDWLEPDERRFPRGMAFFAQECVQRGLVPGLWLAPFLCEKESRVAREHQDWLLRDAQGELVAAAGNWSGAYALDTLNPEVREHITTFMSTVTRDWGFKLLKLDFLFGACLVAHGGMNRGQLMADALDLLRAAVPEDVVFDLCGVPLTSAFGRTEYCRVGCDVGLDWDDVPYMRLLHRERVSTKRNLANTHGRAHLDGKVFRNDPDVFFLRRDVKLSDEQRRRLLEADATLGGVFFTSDDIESWDEGRHATFERMLRQFVNKERRS